jgi:hypothetical protein
MNTVFKNYSTLILVLLLLLVLICAWLFPSAGLILGVTVFLFGLIMASFAVIGKHREAYLQGKITRGVFVRKVLTEIFGILLAMTLAGLLGRYIAQIATEHINNDLTKLIIGILIGLLAGIGVGILIKHTWGRIVKL